MRRRTFFSVATVLAQTAMLTLTGCAGEYVPPAPRVIARPGPLAQPGLAGGPLSTAVPAGNRVALLAPLSGANAERGQALATAAKLAFAEPGSPPLDLLDTGSTPAGAADAAQRAIAGGAGLLLGPLTGAETAAAAGPAGAAGVPMLAFTNDATQARPGVWVLGITPLQQVRRVVGSLAAEGRNRFAAVLPDNDFGRAMGNALTQSLADAGLGSADIRFESGGMQAANSVMRDISGYGSRRGPLDAQIRAARNLHTAEGRKRAAELVRQAIPPAPIDALLLADFGDALTTVASMLSYYDLDPPGVRVFGPTLWADPTAVGGAPLGGARYAAPDPGLRVQFSDRYAAANGGPAPGISDVAYDAAMVARELARGPGFSTAGLCRPEGFNGVDGLFALQPDGQARRALAVFEIQRGGATMIEPAPDRLGVPGT